MRNCKKLMRQFILAMLISILLFTGGSSLVAAHPESSTYALARLLNDFHKIVASYEASIISRALQSMRIIEKLKELSPVIQPTNDMAQFPSLEHPLFPDYLSKQFSQFKYTMDANGAISVDSSGTKSQVERFLKQLRLP